MDSLVPSFLYAHKWDKVFFIYCASLALNENCVIAIFFWVLLLIQ